MVVWAKLTRLGGHYRGSFHAWRDGQSVCANGRRGSGQPSKYARERQPVNACAECVRILAGAPMWPNSSHKGMTLGPRPLKVVA